MKLGILSDSHGRIRALRDALVLLQQSGAEAFIHCGDVGGMDAIEELAGRRVWFVWGNTDVPDPRWRPQVESLGLSWPTGPLDLEIEGKHVAVFHGHEREFERTVAAGRHDLVFYGHTHQRDDQRVGRLRLINPGALHRVSTKTVALLNLETDDLRFLEVV